MIRYVSRYLLTLQLYSNCFRKSTLKSIQRLTLTFKAGAPWFPSIESGVPPKKKCYFDQKCPKFDCENTHSSHQMDNFTSPNQTLVARSQPNHNKATLKNFQIKSIFVNHFHSFCLTQTTCIHLNWSKWVHGIVFIIITHYEHLSIKKCCIYSQWWLECV